MSLIIHLWIMNEKILLMKDKVLIDLTKIGNPTFGFGSISLNYEKLFADYKDHEFDFIFLVPENYVGRFPDKVKYIQVSKWYRYFPFLLPKVQVWHTTTQQVQYLRLTKQTKQILTIHDLNFLHEKQWYSILKHLWRIRRFMKKASVVTTISGYVKNDISDHVKTKGKEIQVIYNGIERIDGQKAKRPDFVNDRLFFFTIGQIRKKKNFHTLLEVMKSFPEYDLYICGDDHFEYATLLRALIAEKKLTNVYLTGPISGDEKVWMYQNCQAFLFPSTLEGFGIPVIEAMQFGKPVFSSSCSSLPEVCGKHAFLWEDFDPVKMVALIKNNLSDFYKDSGRIEAARQYAFSFSYEKHINEYLKLYKELLNK